MLSFHLDEHYRRDYSLEMFIVWVLFFFFFSFENESTFKMFIIHAIQMWCHQWSVNGMHGKSMTNDEKRTKPIANKRKIIDAHDGSHIDYVK